MIIENFQTVGFITIDTAVSEHNFCELAKRCIGISIGYAPNGGISGWFRGVHVMLSFTASCYTVTYAVQLPYGQHLIGFSTHSLGDKQMIDFDADTAWFAAQATLADQYPDVSSYFPAGIYSNLAFNNKLNTIQGYYTGEGFEPIYCTKPPTMSAIVKRIERKRQK